MTDRGSFHSYFLVFVLFSSATLAIWTLLLKALCDGQFYSQLSTITPLHHIDIATRDQRMKNSGAFHWLSNHPSYPVKYNSMRNYFNVSPVNFRTEGWEIASHEEGRRPELLILHVRQTKRRSISPLHFLRPVNVSAPHHFHVRPFP